MDIEEPTCTEILEAIDIHLITSLFTKSLLDLIKNISSSSSTSISLDDNIQTYLFSAINIIKIIYYLILQ